MMTLLFFFWGFMTVWNDILIPRFKASFDLSYFEAMLVQMAFFGAYAVGSLIYYVVSISWGDPINKIGYKKGVVLGLIIAAAGSALFLPAASWRSYEMFLAALFIVGMGFAMLQIAANPYVTILGPERTASSRLNLSQAFNSIGTTIGPLVGGWLIYSVFSSGDNQSVDSVKIPYLCFAGVFLLLAVAFAFARLPEFVNTETMSGRGEIFKHPHTLLGVLAIFMYVGGEVTIGSALISFLGSPRIGSIDHESGSQYLSIFWGGLMIGRFMGSFALGELSNRGRTVAILCTALAAFIMVALLSELSNALHYGVFIVISVALVFLFGRSPHRMLSTYALIIVLLAAVGSFASGELALWSILAIGLFCSVMWSNIFALAIEGLGPLKSQASSLLIMAILGGAILPPVQGMVADRFGIQISFVVPMLAFAYVAYYGMFGYKVGRTKTASL